MATVTSGSTGLTNLFTQQDLTDIAAGTINVSNSTELKVTATDGVVYTFTGTGFGNVSNGVPHSGTITGLTITKSGNTALTETGLNLSVATAVNEITGDNADGLNKSLFNHKDTFVGTNITSGFLIFSGLGGNDTFDMRAVSTAHYYNLSGGAGDDVFNLGASYSSNDIAVDGGSGNDLLILDGDYHANLNFGNIFNIETVKLEPGHNYTTQMLGGVTKGHTITIDGTKLGTGDVMAINSAATSVVTGHLVLEGGHGNDILGGGQSSDTMSGNGGNDVITGANHDALNGGGGNDVLTAISGTLTMNGGSGADTMFGSTGDPELPDNAHVTFYYAQASDSTGANYDQIVDFNGKRDHFSLPDAITSVGAASKTIDPNDIHAPTPDQLAAASGVGAHEALVLSVKDLNHHVFATYLVVDLNGTAGYQSGSDLLINISNPHSMSGLTTASFIEHGI